jgi:hypothetical protein
MSLGHNLLDILSPAGVFFVFCGSFVMLWRKKGRLVLGMILCLIFAYATFPVYDHIQHRYIFNFLPLLIVFAGVGFSSLSAYSGSKVVRVLLVLLIFFANLQLPNSLFSKIPDDMHYVVPNMHAQSVVNGERVVLYGWREMIDVYERFYPNRIIVYINEPIDAADDALFSAIQEAYYLIHVNEWSSDELLIERELRVDLEPVYLSNASIFLYRIE